jgi:hypothetical protein
MDHSQVSAFFRDNQRQTLENKLETALEERVQLLSGDDHSRRSIKNLRDLDLAIDCLLIGLKAIDHRQSGGLRIIARSLKTPESSQSISCTACGTDLLASENR